MPLLQELVESTTLRMAGGRSTLTMFIVTALLLFADHAHGQQPTQAWYQIDSIETSFQQQIVVDPPSNAQILGDVSVWLESIEGRFVAASEETGQAFQLESLDAHSGRVFSGSAVNAICDGIAKYISDLILPNVFVAPHPQDIDPRTGDDLRPAGEGRLRFVIAIDGPAFPVRQFVARYHTAHPNHPSLTGLADTTVSLVRTESGYVAWRPGADAERLQPLREIAEGVPAPQFHLSAIQAVIEALRTRLESERLLGVYVAPDNEPTPQIDIEYGEDLREPGDTAFRLVIVTGVVEDLRTLASGPRVPLEDRINNPIHARIKRHSPVFPWDGSSEERNDLLMRDAIDDFVFRYSRHPGRRVDAALSVGPSGEGITLDYLITENNPVLMYAQVSNTGTADTNKIRERFGFVHNQLTNNDDILAIDFVTSAFDETNGLLGMYEAPIGDSERWRYRLTGMWSDFTASDVGNSLDRFLGESWSTGAQLIFNVYQDAELFVDVFGGVRLLNVEVDNQAVDIVGEELFFLPTVGLSLENVTETASTFGTVAVEWSNPDVTAVDPAELNRLGRLGADDDWYVLTWDLSHSQFLEPLLNPEGWGDPTTPETSTLAHELFLQFRGQYAFDYRLIPQLEGVIGGLYTVRGYPESIAAGDDMYLVTAEYRFHVPRALPVAPVAGELFGKPFRFSPQQVYGRPDWDLILRAFADYGYVKNSRILTFERNEELMGIGVGVELLYRQNLNLRLDWGFAMQPVGFDEVNSGSNRVHFVATLLF